jgi:hypothetical protein
MFALYISFTLTLRKSSWHKVTFYSWGNFVFDHIRQTIPFPRTMGRLEP